MRFFDSLLSSNPPQLLYPSDIEALSDSGVGDTNLAETSEPAILKHPDTRSATGRVADASEAGDSDVQS